MNKLACLEWWMPIMFMIHELALCNFVVTVLIALRDGVEKGLSVNSSISKQLGSV